MRRKREKSDREGRENRVIEKEERTEWSRRNRENSDRQRGQKRVIEKEERKE